MKAIFSSNFGKSIEYIFIDTFNLKLLEAKKF